MQFETFSQFLTMGGHALYVWLSYGLALIILVWNVLIPLIHRRNVMLSLRKRIAREKTKQ